MPTQLTLKAMAGLAITAALLATPNAKAALTINLPDTLNIPGNTTPSDAAVAAALGITTAQLGPLLYKISSSGSESGTLKASYSGVITTDTTTKISTAKITWDGPKVAHAGYLLVKDNTEGTDVWTLVGVNAWDGKTELDVADVFGNHAISFVEFYGKPTGTAVPEPSTVLAGMMLLLPFGLQTF